MPFKIRTKLIIAFFVVIFPFITIVGAIALYNTNVIRKASLKAEAISEELHLVLSLQLAIDKALMPGNDYIITSDKKYIDEFNVASEDVEDLFKKVEETLVVLKGMDSHDGSIRGQAHEIQEEMEILKGVKTAWTNIKEISQKIFEIQNPVGNREAARLMEEMDYKWAYPAIEMLDRHHEIDRKEYAEAVEELQKGWRMAWVIMIGGAVILITFGVFFAFFYSRLFTRPIQTIHNGADAIAGGNFKTRLDIKTGDEIEQLSNAMNEMVAQLDSFYSNMQAMVDERTLALKESQERFKAIVETAKDAIICISESGSIYLWNKSAEEMFGYSAHEAIGKDIHALIIPERFREKANEGFKTFSIRGTGPAIGKTIELIGLKKGGAEFPVELSVSAMNIKDRWHAVGIIRDITERKKVEDALKESEGRYKHLIESVTDYIYTVEVEEGHPVKTTHGPGCVAVTGFTAEEYRKDQFLWLKMVHEEDRPAVVEQANMIFARKAVAPFDHRIMHKDGRIRWVRNTMVARYDKQGRLVACEGLISDITGRKVAESMLIHAKREWEATFDSITDPVFIHDKNFRIIRANKAYQKMAGMEFMEFIGRPYYEVFPKMEKPFKSCIKALELQEEEEEFSCPITNRIFKIRFYPIKDIDDKLLYSIHVMENITEAKKAEKKIKTEMEITTHLLMIAEATAHTTDIDKLLKQVMLCGHEIMKCDVCLSYLHDKETRAFTPSQQYRLPHELIPLFMTEPMDEKTEFVRKIVEGKEPVIIQLGVGSSELGVKNKKTSTPNSELQTPNYFSWLPDINTIAVIPLIGKTDYLGLIIGIYLGTDLKSVPAFTERDKKIMQGISHQLSTALEEAKLYRESIDRAMELSNKIETIQVMHEIDRSILSTLEAKEILETATRLISRLITCDRATVALVDKGRQGFIYAAGFGTTAVPKGAFVPFEDTSAAEVVKTERTQYIADMRGVKRHLSLEERLFKEGFLSHIRTPLIVKGDVAAVLSIGSKSPSAFTPENLSTLEKVASQVGVALENARLVTDLDELFMGTVRALSSAIDAKSPWTRGHSERVTQYALSIAREMGMKEMALKDIELAGLLHDVGKIGTYESILDKPGKLTDEELKVMRQHPVKGAEILDPIKQMQKLIPAIKYHHEFYDGNGYPDGIRGEEIPLYARILAVADTVDAMGADRPYRKGRSADVIVEELKRCSGTQFDPNVVEAFLKTITKGFIHLQ